MAAQSLPPYPIYAHLTEIEVVGDLEEMSSTTRPDYYVVVYLDRRIHGSASSEKKSMLRAPRWEWPEGWEFMFQPSSIIRIVIYRKNEVGSTIEHLVGQCEGEVIELLENNAAIDLKDESGTSIACMLKINLSLKSVHEERFMETVISDAALLDSTVPAATGILALGATLELTKNIMCVVADPPPVLKVSWSILWTVYKTVQHERSLDDTSIRDLVRKLRDMLGVAKDLLVIIGTINDFEEICRTSLKVASAIYVYTTGEYYYSENMSVFRLSDHCKSLIGKCLKICEDLFEKIDWRIDTYIRSPLKTIKNDKLAKKIDKWFVAPDSSRNYEEARTKRQKDTGAWFLDGSRFLELQKKPGLLWLRGTVGCGKTVLCSSIIDKIIELKKEDASITYAYFFFDERDSQNDLQLHSKLIQSLIWQLSLQCDGIPATLVDIYCRGQRQLFTSSLEAMLHHIINGLHSTYIIIDSLNECADRKETLQWINRIISFQMRNIRLVVASRPERDISSVLRPLDPHCIDLVDNSGNHDITMYIKQELQQATEWDEDVRDMIKFTLMEHAQGMFLWVVLKLMELKKCSNRRPAMSQLNSLPRGLHETYDQILLKINSTDCTDTKRFLRWLCFSTRPMKLVEIAETVAVDFTRENEPQYTAARRYQDVRDVLSKCADLISESDDGNVKLAHSSIKDYLLSSHLCSGDASQFHLTSDNYSHSLMAQTCLSYLLHFNSLDMVDQNVAVSFPLAPYAAEHWISHARSGDIDTPKPSLTFALAKKLFASKGNAWFNWVRIWNLDNPYASAMKYRDQSLIGPPLYYAALAGLERLSLRLMKDEDVNAQGGKYGTALQAASAKGHEGIVRLLLKKGAQVNRQGGEYNTALVAAVAGGYEGIVKLLLEKRAGVNVQGGYYNTALRTAVAGGYEAIVVRLLEKGADMNAHGRYYGTALQLASGGGNERIVKLLLDKGANMDASAGDHGNALQAAVAGGYEGIVKLLLEEGVDVNSQGGYYDNALYTASAEGYERIVELLLEKGADVNAQGGEYGNALQAASAGGYERIAKRLQEKGADVNAQGSMFGNALQAASAGGYQGNARLPGRWLSLLKKSVLRARSLMAVNAERARTRRS